MDTAIKNSKALTSAYTEWLQPRYSKATARNYQLYAQNFFKYLKYWHRKLKDIKEVNREVITQYELFIQKNSKKSGAASRRQCFFAIKNFLKWLGKDDSITGNPLEDLKSPKLSQKSKRDILSYEEIEALLAAPGHADKIAIRDRAIMELLYSTAIKGGELIRLENADFDLKERTVSVREKDNQSRVLPIGEDVADWIRDYRVMARPKFMNADESPWFFLSRKGEQLDETSITRMIKKYTKKIGITRNTSAQTIRNSKAAHLFFLGATEERVQALLGHKSSKSTKQYEVLKQLEMRHLHAKYHPRNKRSAR